MTDRDHTRVSYAASLCCPRCERRGVANVSENRFPFTPQLQVSIGQITEGFRLARDGHSLSEVEILCAECRCPVEVQAGNKFA